MVNSCIETELSDFELRFAQVEDVPLILTFIRELASYENLLEEVVGMNLPSNTIKRWAQSPWRIGPYTVSQIRH